MENQNINNQNISAPVEQNTITMHSKPSRSGHYVLFGVMGFVAVAASAGIMIFMNNNKPTTSASYREDYSLDNVISTAPTETPIPTKVLTELERDQQEIDDINIEDIETEISSLDGELNQL